MSEWHFAFERLPQSSDTVCRVEGKKCLWLSDYMTNLFEDYPLLKLDTNDPSTVPTSKAQNLSFPLKKTTNWLFQNSGQEFDFFETTFLHFPCGRCSVGVPACWSVGPSRSRWWAGRPPATGAAGQGDPAQPSPAHTGSALMSGVRKET